MLTVDDVSVREGSGRVNFIVRADGTGPDNVWVDFVTADASASAGAEYVPSSGTLTFSSDAPERTVAVEIVDDEEPEADKTFNLELSNPQNAEIADPVGVATIVDDDGEVCGAPSFDPARDRHVFLWKDCANDAWRLRVTSGADGAAYEGTIRSDEPFVAATPVDVEGDDEFVNMPPERIAFTLDASSGTDGFDFQPATDAGTCVHLTLPADMPVLLGAERQAQTPPFDLATLDACEGGDSPTDLNVVIVFTDDQRFDTFEHMPTLMARLMPRAVNFTNAYVPTPLCCPARASTYSGGFLAQNTLVLDNDPPLGGMAAFDDSVNIGTRLQEAGYRTAFVGKWLNDYIRHKPYVPPGWDTFVGRAVWAKKADWSFFDYVRGSSEQSSSVGTEENTDGQYHVYYERDRVVEFIEDVRADQPFLVFWAPTPPHAPSVPADGDGKAFAGFTYRGRGYGEADLSDKPEWVERAGSGARAADDEEVRDQLRSMLSVDRSIGAVLDVLEARGELEETLLIVTSDNGYLWGEHGLWGKNKPYEESLRVPMLVVMPGIEPREDDNLVSAVLDLAPTVYDVVGLHAESDGMSLVPLLKDPNAAWREELFFEKFSVSRSVQGLWASVRRGDWKYIEYFNGEAELYDLATDPFELENLVNDPAHADVRARLAARTEEQLGLAIKPLFRIGRGTDGEVGQRYSLDVDNWGGTPPFTWEVESGSLPPGVGLDTATGEIAGTPSRAGSWKFTLRVTGSRTTRQAGKKETFVSEHITIRIR